MSLGTGVSMNIPAIAASLVAAFLFSIFGYCPKTLIIPFSRSLINQTLTLSGTWYSHFTTPSENRHDMVMTLRQRWRLLHGEISVTKHPPRNNVVETKVYSFTGEVRERMVILSAWNSDTQAFGAHTELLEVVGDARAMRGLGLWYSVTREQLQSSEFHWTKTRPERRQVGE